MGDVHLPTGKQHGAKNHKTASMCPVSLAGGGHSLGGGGAVRALLAWQGVGSCAE